MGWLSLGIITGCVIFILIIIVAAYYIEKSSSEQDPYDKDYFDHF